MKPTVFNLHKTRGVSARASEMILSHPRVGERSGRVMTAKGKQAGLSIIEAHAHHREPRQADLLGFAEAVDPAWGAWLHAFIAEAERAMREMEELDSTEGD